MVGVWNPNLPTVFVAKLWHGIIFLVFTIINSGLNLGFPGLEDPNESFVKTEGWRTHYAERPLQNAPFRPISALGSHLNPRNISYISVVKIITRLDLERN